MKLFIWWITLQLMFMGYAYVKIENEFLDGVFVCSGGRVRVPPDGCGVTYNSFCAFISAICGVL